MHKRGKKALAHERLVFAHCQRTAGEEIGMCGIVGVTGEPAPVQVYKGLLALQHRGQDSAGIACTYGNRIALVKAPGLVQQVFDTRTLGSLKGEFGIGHVRYATIGASLNLDAQPFTDRKGLVTLAYNGNIVNYEELAAQFTGSLQSTCDAEVLTEILGRAFAAERTLEGIFKGVGEVMDKANGSYSAVALVAGLGLLAFRDPRAIKPLVMGQKGREHAFASETNALDAIGFSRVRDLAPGEAVLVGLDREVHVRQVRPGRPAHCMFEWVYFARPDSTLDGRSVYEARFELGRQLAALYGNKKEGGEVVVAVPDTSRTAAQALSEETGIPCREGLIKNRYIARTFIMATQVARENAVDVKLNPIAAVLDGKKALLVDDSIVRGTTARKILRLVRKGAKSVHMLVTCPPIRHPCFYGIDFPVRDELVANGKSEEEIRKELELDGLTYMNIEGLRKAIGLPGLCTACLDGRYPTAVTSELAGKVAEARLREREKIGKLG